MGFMVRLCLSFSLPCFDIVSLPLAQYEGVGLPIVRFPSEKIILHISVGSVCLWEEAN